MKYTWDKDRGVLDENNQQVCQVVTTNREKLRNMLGKTLVDALNKKEEQ